MPVFDPVAHPDWCSVASADLPLTGTAAHERVWVLLEVSGAWGRDVLDGTALGPEVSERISARLSAAGARLLLIRAPGREGQHVAEPRYYICRTIPGERRTYTGTLGSAAELAELDLSGDTPPPGARESVPPVLVCTHGRRDRCCAARGRPVAAALESALAGRLAALDPAARVWECSHTGGHRFAPVLLLPGSGYTYGSGDTAGYVDAVVASLSDRVAIEGLRGRSTWTPPEQVAEIAVRASGVEAGIDRLVPTSEPGEPGVVVVRHADGRRWRVVLDRHPVPARPASCGKAPKPGTAWSVVSLLAD